MTSSLRVVLFDWRGTLFYDVDNVAWLRRAAASIGRELSSAEAQSLSEAIDRAATEPDIVRVLTGSDSSTERHRAASVALFRAAGADEALAVAIADLDGALDVTFPYVDAGPVLKCIHDAGLSIGVVSDIHFDLRPHFAAHSLDQYVSAWVHSYEHGIEKPDRKMFELALNALGASPNEALMVGDRADRDGGAATAGILTLILPRWSGDGPRGLDVVLRLVGVA